MSRKQQRGSSSLRLTEHLGPSHSLTATMASPEALATFPFVVRERGVESGTFAGTCRAARLAFRRWWPTLARWMLLELLQGVTRTGQSAVYYDTYDDPDAAPPRPRGRGLSHAEAWYEGLSWRVAVLPQGAPLS